jgi:hypothetical protein
MSYLCGGCLLECSQLVLGRSIALVPSLIEIFVKGLETPSNDLNDSMDAEVKGQADVFRR